MRPVERYRAWALKGPYLLHHDAGTVQVEWPAADALLSHDPSAPLRVRLIGLAGSAAGDLLDAVADDDGFVLELIVQDLAEYFGCTRARRLLALLDRYFDAVAADLDDTYGMDVLDVFAGRRVPDEVMGRIDNLPRHSRASEALAQDDELAELAGDEAESGGPLVRFTEWTPEAERLSTIADRLGEILAAIAGFGGTRLTVAPLPRPTGATARLQQRKDDAEYDDLVADVTEAQARWADVHGTDTP